MSRRTTPEHFPHCAVSFVTQLVVHLEAALAEQFEEKHNIFGHQASMVAGKGP
jgi:hypothetical protein